MTALTTADLPLADLAHANPDPEPHDHPRPSATRTTAHGAADRWLTTHYVELVRRARLRHGHLDAEARDEAVAETLAYTTQAVHGAAGRGTLDRLTPWTCVHYAARHIEQGRRVAGFSSRCVLSRACRQKHGVHVTSLDFDHADADDELDFHEAVADPKADQPLDAARRRHDYPQLLDREGVSPKARATLRFLAATHGSGRQSDLAAELMLSPARITQLKAELARALATDGYHSPLGRRPQRCS